MGQDLPEAVYEPRPRAGGLTVWAEAFRDAWRGRELAWRFFLRDLSARYRQSVLGWGWALLVPAATAVLFTYLKDESFLKIRDPQGLPYPAYVLFGLAVWQVFAGGVTAGANSLLSAGGLISRANFPREALVFASFGGALFDVLLRIVLVAAVFAWYGVVPAWTAVFLPLVLLPLLLLTLGLSFLLAVFHALVRDVGSALAVGLNLFFFLVPVVYPPPRHWPKVLINDLNPVSALLTAAHDVALQGELSRPLSFAAASLFALLVFLIGWRVFRLAQPLIAERV